MVLVRLEFGEQRWAVVSACKGAVWSSGRTKMGPGDQGVLRRTENDNVSKGESWLIGVTLLL